MNTKICAAFQSWFTTERTNAPAPESGRTRPRPPKKLDRRVVPDEKWPGMYRLRRPDGSLSDMANLTRIKDALRVQDEGSS
jgi:hypothetical protein